MTMDDIKVSYAEITYPTAPDDSKFVDPDILEEFRGLTYFTGVPMQYQLSRDIKKLTIAIEKLAHLLESLPRDKDGNLR